MLRHTEIRFSQSLKSLVLQAQLTDKDAEIKELNVANQQLRALCIRLQSALEYSSEQMHGAAIQQASALHWRDSQPLHALTKSSEPATTEVVESIVLMTGGKIKPSTPSKQHQHPGEMRGEYPQIDCCAQFLSRKHTHTTKHTPRRFHHHFPPHHCRCIHSFYCSTSTPTDYSRYTYSASATSWDSKCPSC